MIIKHRNYQVAKWKRRVYEIRSASEKGIRKFKGDEDWNEIKRWSTSRRWLNTATVINMPNFIYILYRDDLQETVNLFCLLSLWLDSLYPWHLCIATTVNTETQHLSTSLCSSKCFYNDFILSNAPWAYIIIEGLIFSQGMWYVATVFMLTKV